ncbi:MAG: 30S ribosomal protein S8 [Patescibacteria group bacterium]|nr:30S ribosomal protein S8 [Patescibacteria group bacterium]
MVIVNDPISDLITRLRNGLSVNKSYVLVPDSKLRIGILQVLKDQGYITDFSKTAVKQDQHEQIKVVLKYADGQPVIEGIERISKPGQRIYVASNRLERVLGGVGVAVLSTSQGVMTDSQARKAGVGGELLFKVW